MLSYSVPAMSESLRFSTINPEIPSCDRLATGTKSARNTNTSSSPLYTAGHESQVSVASRQQGCFSPASRWILKETRYLRVAETVERCVEQYDQKTHDRDHPRS